MSDGQNQLVAGQLEVGQTGPSLVVDDLSRKDIVKYAGASGDFNPIHYSDAYAKQAGNKSVFAHGMMSAGFVSRLLCDWFGLGNITQFSTRFQRQVWPGDTLTVRGRITDLDRRAESVIVTAEVTVSNQDDQTVIDAQASSTVPYQ
ncbi:MaoC family dehydratase [Halorarius halobius]|uniref:MaoC family dehydratase n=1 Tax=Halorarius halobius TaxID=2962671 RepID=UPI0020CCD592|nr:MaoC/PaaZ C-terminal domain-containing protein [Halorarius halobius]